MAPNPDSLPELDTALRKLARRLVVDAAKADDVVQDAWLVALRRDESTVASWAAWLAGTVRKLTGEARRAQERRSRHEASAAPTDRAPSAAELVERESTRRQLMDALLALPETYRIAVAMRYLEDLPPRRIAAKLGIPTETARTRVKRGIELLRERLDADRGGDRRAWGLALAPLAVPKATALGATLTTAAEILLMNVATKAALVTVALCGVTWIVLALNEPRTITHPERGDASALSASDAPRREDAAAADTELAATRALIENEPEAPGPAATTSSATGSLEVALRFASDGAAGAGVGVEVRRPTTTRFTEHPRAIAGADGIARLRDLAPGPVEIRVDRGGSAKAMIEAGRTARVDVVVAPGAQVDGVVLSPAREPVASADVFLSLDMLLRGFVDDGGTGFIVARTGSDGRFSIRDVTSMHLLGARKPGFAPSPLRQFTGHAGAREHYELVLSGVGAVLSGRVVDQHDAPIAGAGLELSEPQFPGFDTLTRSFEDGGTGRSSVPLQAHTNESGRFAFDGVAPKSQILTVRATGFAVVWTDVTPSIDGGSESVIRLPPTPIIVGSVTDASGDGVGDASVELTHEWLEGPATMTDATGTFRLETLPCGTTFSVKASAKDGREIAMAVTLVAGVETRVDLVLPSVLTIRGRIVDERGEPRTGFLVQAWPKNATSADDRLSFKATETGTFSMNAHRDVEHRLELNPFGPVYSLAAIVENVRPSADEIVVVVPDSAMPTAAIKVCVVDSAGAPVTGAEVNVLHAAAYGGSNYPTDASTGCCAVEGLVPGAYRVSIQAAGYARTRLPQRVVGPRETLDYGTVQLDKPGSLIATVSGLTAETSHRMIWKQLVGPDGTNKQDLDRTHRDGVTTLSSAKLAPGRWTLVAQFDQGMYVAPTEVEIRSGKETRVELTAVPASIAKVKVSGAKGARLSICRVFTLDGRLVGHAAFAKESATDCVDYSMTLPRGTYDVVVIADTLRGEARLELAGAEGSVDVHVK